jgi:hypothetical protein
MASSSYEEAKQFLLRDNNGSNLYDHLSETLLKILVEKPDDAVDMFEHISSLVKQGSFKPSDGEGKTVEQDPVAVYFIFSRLLKVNSCCRRKHNLIGLKRVYQLSS